LFLKIAIIGTGISGLTAAYLLNKHHDITVFEASDRIGGHTATVDVAVDGKTWAIDTGFIVYNDWTYPNFIRLMNELGVKKLPTDMGFSVHCERTSFEYSGSSIGSLFAQRRNMFNPSFLRMLWDIVRFNKESIADLDAGKIPSDITLGEYLEARGYGSYFIDRYLVPMGSAIWSASTQMMAAFPLRFFVQFFKNHGLLSVNDRPQWRVLQGGSRAYLKPLTAGFHDRIQVNSPVTSIRRTDEGVFIRINHGDEQHFDQIVIASHSDQALAMLSDASEAEKQILGAIPYQDNEVILHTDISMLPKARAAWASWNYHLTGNDKSCTVLTYNMNILQRLESDTTFCVTLNNTDSIDPEKILRRFNYAHPVFTLGGIAAQQRWSEINGANKTWFCGAYWRNGFHEDGVVSALKVCEALGVKW
jgi:predicted NAD/FAD-binding protein